MIDFLSFLLDLPDYIFWALPFFSFFCFLMFFFFGLPDQEKNL